MSDGLLRTADGFRAAYRETLGNVGEIVSPLDAASWDLPTGCPGWTVRDIVSHISAVESFLIGRELPDHQIPEGLSHVRPGMPEVTEIGVDYRRAWPLDDLLAEYRDVAGIRLEQLEALRDDQLESDALGVFGVAKLRSTLTIRVFDLWTHEQDIRRATDAPGGFDGRAGLHSRELLARGVGGRAAERLDLADGTTVLLDITGPGGAQRWIRFAGHKARVSEESSEDPTVTLTLDLNTLTVLGCGRADDPSSRDRVGVEGDVTLGRKILEDVAFTP
ncbi:MAG TPA: maleylpyruvate isomerase family mycothiol-dependent enzyme [Candidatus Dormibacteraeota bacterium]